MTSCLSLPITTWRASSRRTRTPPEATVSELRPIDQLQPLLRHHPLWNDFEEYATNGIDYPFTGPMSEEKRIKMLDENIKRGNHKSALKEEDMHHVTKLMRQDVELGYAVPISLECITKLKGAEVYPIGLQS